MRQRCFQQRAATSASQPHSWLLQLPFELLGAHVWPLLSSGDQARLRSTCRALRALADAQIQKNAAAEDGDAASGPLQLVCVPAWERVLDGSGTFHGAPCAVHAPLLKVLISLQPAKCSCSMHRGSRGCNVVQATVGCSKAASCHMVTSSTMHAVGAPACFDMSASSKRPRCTSCHPCMAAHDIHVACLVNCAYHRCWTLTR